MYYEGMKQNLGHPTPLLSSAFGQPRHRKEPHGWGILLCSAFPVIVPIATCHESPWQVSVYFICLANINVEEGEALDARKLQVPRIRRAFRSLLAKLLLPK